MSEIIRLTSEMDNKAMTSLSLDELNSEYKFLNSVYLNVNLENYSPENQETSVTRLTNPIENSLFKVDGTANSLEVFINENSPGVFLNASENNIRSFSYDDKLKAYILSELTRIKEYYTLENYKTYNDEFSFNDGTGR